MTSETEHEGNVPNRFVNPVRVCQNYLIYWIEANRNFYENAIKTNEQWLKAICDLWLKGGYQSQRETVKIE
jgi:hypothetical protein